MIPRKTWLPITGPKVRKELWKTGCKVTFTSAETIKQQQRQQQQQQK